METLAKSFMPEIYTDEAKIGFADANTLSVKEQTGLNADKYTFLCQYQILLAFLWNIRPHDEIEDIIKTFAESALRLGENDIAHQVLDSFKRRYERNLFEQFITKF